MWLVGLPELKLLEISNNEVDYIMLLAVLVGYYQCNSLKY